MYDAMALLQTWDHKSGNIEASTVATDPENDSEGLVLDLANSAFSWCVEAGGLPGSSQGCPRQSRQHVSSQFSPVGADFGNSHIQDQVPRVGKNRLMEVHG